MAGEIYKRDLDRMNKGETESPLVLFRVSSEAGPHLPVQVRLGWQRGIWLSWNAPQKNDNRNKQRATV